MFQLGYREFINVIYVLCFSYDSLVTALRLLSLKGLRRNVRQTYRFSIGDEGEEAVRWQG